MGQKLLAFYGRAFDIAGYAGKVELARLTKIPSTQAEQVQDTPLLIQEFEDALKQLTTPAKKQSSGGTEELAASLSEVKRKVLRERLPAQEAARLITELSTRALKIERSSIWMLNDDRTAITSVDLYSAKDREHSGGATLSANDFPKYFKAIRTERTLAAHDAHTDPHTSEFSEPYLRPLGINSLLDVPIWSKGRIFGVLCQEHTGPARKWTPEEEDFAYAAGSLYGLSVG